MSRIRPTELDQAAMFDMASALRQEGDDTLAEALDNVVAMQKAVLDENSAFMRYVRFSRERAIKAIKTFARVDPRDTESVIVFHNAVADYLRLMEFAASTFDVVSERPISDVEDADRLGDGLGDEEFEDT